MNLFDVYLVVVIIMYLVVVIIRSQKLPMTEHGEAGKCCRCISLRPRHTCFVHRS